MVLILIFIATYTYLFIRFYCTYLKWFQLKTKLINKHIKLNQNYDLDLNE